MKPVESSRQPVVELLAGPDLDLLTKLTVAGTFDQAAWTALGGAAERYETLDTHPMLEPASAGYRLRPAFHRMLLPRLDPAERAELARTLSGQPADETEAALQAMVLDPASAPALLRERMREPLAQWDLVAAERWLAVADAALARVDPTEGDALRRARAELGAAAGARALWRTSNLRLYVEQAATVTVWERLRDGPTWALQLHAPGGSGKSSLLRWLIAHRCVPEGVPVALVDFDRTEWIERLVTGASEFLRPVLEQLDAQLPDRPLRTLTGGTGPLEPSAVGRALASALGDRHALVLLDTTERLLLAYRTHLGALWRLLAELRAAAPHLRVILAGRQDLLGSRSGGQPEVPGLRDLTAGALTTVKLPGFSRDEAASYLREVREVPPDQLDRLVRLAVGPDGTASPLKLAILAQMALAGALLDDAELAARLEVEDLVERVIDAIPSPALRWVVRWAVLADPLTRSFYDGVLWPLLPPQAGASAEAGSSTWDALVDYVIGVAWMRRVQGVADAIEYHPDVRDPLRRLWADEPVVPIVHERARAWFAERAQPAGAVYHAIELGPGPAADEAERGWGPMPGGREDVARVIVEAGQRGRELPAALVARAWAELTAGALGRGDAVVAREHAEVLAGLSSDGLPDDMADWLLGAVDPGGDARLEAAADSTEPFVRVGACAELGRRRLAQGRLDAIPVLRTAWETALGSGLDADHHQLALGRALFALDQHRRALAFLEPSHAHRVLGEPLEDRLLRELGRVEPAPMRSGAASHRVQAHLAVGDVASAYALSRTFGRREGRALQALVSGALLRLDEALVGLERDPLTSARLLLDVGTEEHEREAARLLRGPLGGHEAQAAVLRARAAVRLASPAPGAAGPGTDARLALAGLLRGQQTAVADLERALAAVELPERRLMLLDGLIDAHDPDLGALVPLVEHASLDGALALRAHQALVFGWGGRRADAERLVRDGLAAARWPAVVRQLARVHRVLGLPAEALGLPDLDVSGLPPHSPLVGVTWLEVAEALVRAGDRAAAQQAVDRGRERLPPSSPWGPRLDRVLDECSIGSGVGPAEDHTLRVELGHDLRGWSLRASMGRGSEATDRPPDGAQVPAAHLPPVELGWALAEQRASVVEALAGVLGPLSRWTGLERPPDRVALTASAGAALPWELALWPTAVHRAGPRGLPRRHGRRVLRIGGGGPRERWTQSGAPRSSGDRRYAERGFELVEGSAEIDRISDLLRTFAADILHVSGTFAADGDRVFLAGLPPLFGESLGRVAGTALVVVDAETGGIPDGERWHQLLLRNQFCHDVARSAAVVLGVGAVPDALRAVHDLALVGALAEARAAGELALRVRMAAADDAFHAVTVHVAQPDLAWAPE